MRGIAAEELAPGVKRGPLVQLAEWTAWADKVLVF
jgi:sulfur relay (sulfurtransferase) complex TusBCD TusD component (DsrE family)